LVWKNKCKNNITEIKKYFKNLEKIILLKFSKIGKINKNIKNLN
jgi:hypothetical protein